jgi:hypothetical protein
MEPLTIPVEASVKGSANEALNPDPLVPRQTREATYLTRGYETTRDLNEETSATKRLGGIWEVRILYYVTRESPEEFDLAEELSMPQAANAARRFRETISDHIIDVDLGPGI